MTLLGAEVGLAVFRPWDHHVALSLSGSHTSSLVSANGSPSPGATRLVTPSAGAKCPDVVVHRVEQPDTIPRSAWVHASDGVNVPAGRPGPHGRRVPSGRFLSATSPPPTAHSVSG